MCMSSQLAVSRGVLKCSLQHKGLSNAFFSLCLHCALTFAKCVKQGHWPVTQTRDFHGVWSMTLLKVIITTSRPGGNVDSVHVSCQLFRIMKDIL